MQRERIEGYCKYVAVLNEVELLAVGLRNYLGYLLVHLYAHANVVKRGEIAKQTYVTAIYRGRIENVKRKVLAVRASAVSYSAA